MSSGCGEFQIYEQALILHSLPEYLQRGSFNVFYVDWFNLSSSIFYPAVVHNIEHVGECTAQLVNRIRDAGGVDIHVIGFSLGAQLANFVSNSLKPNYLLPRITGLFLIDLKLFGISEGVKKFIRGIEAEKNVTGFLDFPSKSFFTFSMQLKVISCYRL